MIALPIAAICAVQVVLASSDLSAREFLDLKLGTAEAVLVHSGRAFIPSFDGVGGVENSIDETGAAETIPGWGKSLEAKQDALGQLLHRQVAVATLGDLQYGPELADVLVLGVDFSSQPAYPVKLVSGRYPSAPGEGVVTPGGLKAGIPADGSFGASERGGELTIRVVGCVELSIDESVGLVTFPDAKARVVRYLARGVTLTWSEAESLARYGLAASSRGIAQNPPERRILPAEASRLFYTSLISAAALVEVALILGPAFAIGAAKRRRQLGLIAMNGAVPAQLRRVAIGDGIVLGVTATLLGTIVGTIAGVSVWLLLPKTDSVLPPLEVPIPSLVLVLTLGAAAPVLVALVASRGLSKLDLLAALGEPASSPERGRRIPLLGAAASSLGVALVWVAPQVTANEGSWVFWLWAVGTVSVIIGALLFMPGVLGLVARFSAGAGLVARMSTRQSARQHGRSSATLAAVLAGGMVLSVAWTIVLSFDANEARNYRPTVPIGQAVVELPDAADPKELRQLVTGSRPGLAVVEFAVVTGWSPKRADAAGLIAAIPAGCDPADTISDDSSPGCASLSTGSPQMGSGILAGSLAELSGALDLTSGQRSVLAAGGVLVNTADRRDDVRWSQNRIDQGSLTFAEFAADGNHEPRFVTLKAAAIDNSTLQSGVAPQTYGGIITIDTANRLHWVTNVSWLQLFRHGTAINDSEEQAINRIVSAWNPRATIAVERGFSPQPQPLLWAATITVGLLAIIAAAMAALLATTQLRPYYRALSAVGASPNLTRNLAATQSGYLALVGTLLGCAIGVAVAAPLVVAVTGGRGASVAVEPVLVVAWPVIIALVVLIPLGSAITGGLSLRNDRV